MEQVPKSCYFICSLINTKKKKWLRSASDDQIILRYIVLHYITPSSCASSRGVKTGNDFDCNGCGDTFSVSTFSLTKVTNSTLNHKDREREWEFRRKKRKLLIKQ